MSGSYALRTLATDAPVSITIIQPSSFASTTSGGFSGGGAHVVVPIVIQNTPSVSTVFVPATTPQKLALLSINVNAKSDASLIKNLQAVLNNALGSDLKVALTADGKWGNKTTKAIKMFQKSAGVKVTGTINTSTRTKLNATIK